LFAQVAAVEETEQLNVFIDCNNCDQTFFRQEATHISYVRDRLLSDVHVQILQQRTASGGQEFSFFFYGQKELAGHDDTLVMTTDINNTTDEIRRKQLKTLEIGLVSYLAKSGYMEFLDVAYNEESSSEPVQEEDPWKNWVFRINANGWFNGEERFQSMSLNGGLNIDRITEDWKIESNLWMNYNHNTYHLEDEIVTAERRSLYASANVVKSLTEHWSVGATSEFYSSLFDNYKGSTELTPAVEYNIFPYSESTKRQLRIGYRIGGMYNEYIEETIYQRLNEMIYMQELGFSALFQQKWGSVGVGARGRHFFHDFDLNKLNFNANVSLRLFKGFNLNLRGNLALIHDQVSLPLGDATEEEVLLSQRQLQTGYRYWGSAGFSYTFGSIYNSIVNPRFGDF
jgi:hypothetical protein